ncbi:MAG: VIT1/CCC1 transporter family protein [Poseidonia sp.]|jgi:VIT1/CCC1 family predicted Fe2+/Mn2+ transporter
MAEEDDYSSSVVLGISDALIEMTGILVGLTFALEDMNLIALSGLVTGIAASFSMGASEFLSKRTEASGDSPLKAAFATWAAYVGVVVVLVTPYLIVEQALFGLEEHVAAMGITLFLGIAVVAGFNGWLTRRQQQTFLPRFLEMLGILALMTLISFAMGKGLSAMLAA